MVLQKSYAVVLSLVLLGASLGFITGCSSNAQQTAAQTLVGLQAGVDIYIALYAPTLASKAQIDDAFTKAIADVASFKPGNAGSTTVQVLQDLAGALDDVPLNGQTDQAIAAAVNFIDNEIMLLQAESTTASAQQQSTAFIVWLSADTAPPAAATRKHVWAGKPVKKPSQLKKAWNTAAPKAKLK